MAIFRIAPGEEAVRARLQARKRKEGVRTLVRAWKDVYRADAMTEPPRRHEIIQDLGSMSEAEFDEVVRHLGRRSLPLSLSAVFRR
jgi:hypothetical protein